MKKKLTKVLSSLTMAVVLSCASLTSFAADCIEEEEVQGISLEEYSNWGIDEFVENIKTPFKLQYPDQAEIIDTIVNTISYNEGFINMFDEQGASAFQIIEDSLREVLEPSASLCDSTDELYFSKYNVSPIKQESSSKNAAAATLMALTGSGVSGYNQTNIYNQLNAYSTPETINKITSLLKSKIPDKNNLGVRTRAFVPINNNADWLIDCIGNSLTRDTVPVIQINNAGDLNWYNSGETGKRYLVATCVDTLAECVTFYDPDSSHYGTHILDYDEIDKLLTKSKVIWISSFDQDKSSSGLAEVMAEYPDGSYYSLTGKKCTCHGIGYNPCYWDNSCDCINFDNSVQCVAFAKYVYYRVHGYHYNSSSKVVIDRNLSSGSIAKSYLKGKPMGTYVYGSCNSTPHAIVIVATSDNNITFYHANGYRGESCQVRYETRSWDLFASYFTHLTNYAV